MTLSASEFYDAGMTLVDLLSTDEGAEIDFEPTRLGLMARPPEL